MNELSLPEKNDLQYHEQRIERGLATFIEVGESLWKIRENKLYRQTHKTFEDYCKERWGISKTHANRLIGANEIASEMAPTGAKITSERQARELAKVPEDQRQEVVERASEATGGKLTAKAIKEARKEPVKPRQSLEEQVKIEQEMALDGLMENWVRASSKTRNTFLEWVKEQAITTTA